MGVVSKQGVEGAFRGELIAEGMRPAAEYAAVVAVLSAIARVIGKQ